MSEEENGLNDLLGKKVVVYSCRFFYTGTLKSIDSDYITLSEAKIIYANSCASMQPEN